MFKYEWTISKFLLDIGICLTWNTFQLTLSVNISLEYFDTTVAALVMDSFVLNFALMDVIILVYYLLIATRLGACRGIWGKRGPWGEGGFDLQHIIIESLLRFFLRGELSWEFGVTLPQNWFEYLPWTHKKLHWRGEPFRFRGREILWKTQTDILLLLYNDYI